MKVIVDKKFEKSFKKLSPKIKREFEKRIKLFLEDINSPILNTHKLSGKLKNLWIYNVFGDIRVVFDKSQKDVIILIDIGHIVSFIHNHGLNNIQERTQFLDDVGLVHTNLI